jgi:hypothetical protein
VHMYVLIGECGVYEYMRVHRISQKRKYVLQSFDTYLGHTTSLGHLFQFREPTRMGY